MPIINSQIKPFKATAYHNGDFVPVTEENFKGKWSVIVFYPADFTFVCPTELGDLAEGPQSTCTLRSKTVSTGYRVTFFETRQPHVE